VGSAESDRRDDRRPPRQEGPKEPEEKGERDRGEVEAAESPSEVVHAQEAHRDRLGERIRVRVEAFEAAFELEEMPRDESRVVTANDRGRELVIPVLVAHQDVPPRVDVPAVETDEKEHDERDRPGLPTSRREVDDRREGERRERDLEPMKGIAGGEGEDDGGVRRGDREEDPALLPPQAKERRDRDLPQDQSRGEKAEREEEIEAGQPLRRREAREEEHRRAAPDEREPGAESARGPGRGGAPGAPREGAAASPDREDVGRAEPAEEPKEQEDAGNQGGVIGDVKYASDAASVPEPAR
jgi:hypothetical protein